MTASEESPVVVWFRNDLRLADNLALSEAINVGRPVVALFVLDDGSRERGGAQRWWLHYSLQALAKDLEAIDIALVLRRSDPAGQIDDVVAQSGASSVYWNRRYDPAGVELDRKIKADLKERGLDVRSFAGQLLHEPLEVTTGSGKYYKVYTPFWRALEGRDEPREPLPSPQKTAAKAGPIRSEKLVDWRLLPTRPDWSGGIARSWTPGEAGARNALERFVSGPFDDYDAARDFPGRDETSRLSPHLAFGEITPYQIWHETRRRPKEVAPADRTTYRKELVWREFAYHLLFHNPKLADENFDNRFDAFPWAENDAGFEAWTMGRTGYPIVDAGMRQLWQTGWMHNRVRMICASFLTKHLLIDWRRGEDWFWDTLVDADRASNAAQWQWVAGSGADAAPYFRIFNPVIQGKKFDPEGDYVRRYVPELKDMPAKHIHAPWEASDTVLGKAGVTLGDTYPEPVVDHKHARQRALDAYEKVKKAA